MNIIILHSRKYDFKDDVSGRQIQGIKISYIFNDDLEPFVVDSNEEGYQIANGTLALDKSRSLHEVPGVYEANFRTIVNAKNQPVQKLQDVRFMSTVPGLYISQEKVAASK